MSYFEGLFASLPWSSMTLTLQCPIIILYQQTYKAQLMAVDPPHKAPNPFSEDTIPDVNIPNELNKGQWKTVGFLGMTTVSVCVNSNI